MDHPRDRRGEAPPPSVRRLRLHSDPSYGGAAVLPHPATTEVRELARALGVTVTFADILTRRGYGDNDTTRRFLDPKLTHLSSPHEMAGRPEAIERISHAVRRKERIVVFGDYDCDGITSTAIVTEALGLLGADVTPRLASRFGGGYGVSDEAVDQILEARPELVITCDCGSSDHDRLERLKRAGVDVVVIDHHVVPPEPLPVVAFLNPNRPECGYGYKHLASCGLALVLVAGLRAALQPSLDVRQWLDLVALGTVADVVPLDGDNRSLVRAGMRGLETTTRVGLKCLAEHAGVNLSQGVTAELIGFQLAPRINAPGRLASPMPALELLLTRDIDKARAASIAVERARQERRRIQDKILAEAVAEVEEHKFHQDPAIVLGRVGWHQGIVGIVAAQLVDRYGKPTVVVAFDERGGRGSARGPKGAALHDLLTACVGAPIRFGGHQAAAGVEVHPSALERFRQMFNAAALQGQASRGGAVASGTSPEALLDASDAPFDVVTNLSTLEPCGPSNPLPPVALVDVRVVRVKVVRGGHLQVQLALNGREPVHGFGYTMGPRAAHIQSGARVNVVGWLKRDSYRGGTAVGMRIAQLEVRPG